MARGYSPYAETQRIQFERERMDRAAAASGMLDPNSAAYRHAKLEGWPIGESPKKAARTQQAAPAMGQPVQRGMAAQPMRQVAATPQQDMYQQYGQMIEKGRAARKQKRDMDHAALASAMLYARDNNGFIPAEMVPSLGEQFGAPIAGGNYTADGNFVLYGRDEVMGQDGRPITNGRIVPIAVATPEMQFQVLSRSGLGQDMQQEIYNKLAGPGGKRKDQLAARGITDPGEKARLAEMEAQGKLMKDAFDMQHRQMQMNVGIAQKELERLGKERQALATSAVGEDGAKANAQTIGRIDQQMRNYQNYLGTILAGDSPEWQRALIGDMGGEQGQRREANKTIGEREITAADTVKVDKSWTRRSKEKPIARHEVDPQTGEIVVNTRHEQRDGTNQIRLQPGGLPHYGEKWVTWAEENGQTFQRPRKGDEGNVVQLNKEDDGVDGIAFRDGEKEVFIPAGKVISVGKGRYKVEGESGNYSLVPTKEEPNWFASRKSPSKNFLDGAQLAKDDKTGEVKMLWKGPDGKTVELSPGDSVTDNGGTKWTWNGYDPDAPDKGFTTDEESDSERQAREVDEHKKRKNKERNSENLRRTGRHRKMMGTGVIGEWSAST